MHSCRAGAGHSSRRRDSAVAQTQANMATRQGKIQTPLSRKIRTNVMDTGPSEPLGGGGKQMCSGCGIGPRSAGPRSLWRSGATAAGEARDPIRWNITGRLHRHRGTKDDQNSIHDGTIGYESRPIPRRPPVIPTPGFYPRGTTSAPPRNRRARSQTQIHPPSLAAQMRFRVSSGCVRKAYA